VIAAKRLTSLAGVEKVRAVNGMNRAPARIVVIDDDAEMRAMLEQTLESAGYSVASGNNGKYGIEQCSMSPADLVITDLFMPNKEGIETIIELHRDFPRVKVIAVSGKTDAGPLFFAARRLGAVRTLPKPFQPREILALVEQVLSDADVPPSSPPTGAAAM
jgi:DNA-binding NtrC family response regulator